LRSYWLAMGRAYGIMTRPARIVSIDGLSGTGKTTVSTLLASVLAAESVAAPPSEMRDVSEWFARAADNHPQVAGAFFVSALGMALIRASDARARGRSVVLDRYIWSTVGHLVVLGATLEGMLASLPPVEVDVRVLLVCNEDVRSERTVSRNGRGILVSRLADSVFRRRVLETQTAFTFDLVVDTSSLTPHDVADRVMKRINEL
jgi:thymidylate kinase